MNITTIKTPGHTPGSTCYLIKELNTVFTGDVLFHESIGRTDFEKGDLKTLKSSIRDKLFTLEDDVKVWPGHGLETTIKNEKANNGFLKG